MPAGAVGGAAGESGDGASAKNGSARRSASVGPWAAPVAGRKMRLSSAHAAGGPGKRTPSVSAARHEASSASVSGAAESISYSSWPKVSTSRSTRYSHEPAGGRGRASVSAGAGARSSASSHSATRQTPAAPVAGACSSRTLPAWTWTVGTPVPARYVIASSTCRPYSATSCAGSGIADRRTPPLGSAALAAAAAAAAGSSVDRILRAAVGAAFAQELGFGVGVVVLGVVGLARVGHPVERVA